MDADDYLEFDEDFESKKLDNDAYLFNIQYGPVRHQRTQLIKSALPWEWKGVLQSRCHILRFRIKWSDLSRCGHA